MRSLLLDTLDAAHQATLAGNRPSPSDVALIGLACQEAMAAAVHAVDVAVRISGTSSVRESSRLDRLQRDVNTMRQHIMFSPAIGAPLGRQLAGIDTVAFPFLVPTERCNCGASSAPGLAARQSVLARHGCTAAPAPNWPWPWRRRRPEGARLPVVLDGDSLLTSTQR